MSMTEWAEREVALACKRENPDRKEGEFDYGCACHESALKAFKCLCEDGHSGTSIGFTKNILMRLIDGKPLTPIEDTADMWNYSFQRDKDKDGPKVYQCKRMRSLFKQVYQDGTIKYSDIDASVCVNINHENSWYSSGTVRKLVEEMFPITMPYMPESKPIKVYCEDFLTDRANGDFDTVGVFYCIKPDGERIDINRFFRASDSETGWAEINRDEYDNRKKLAEELHDELSQHND